MNAKRRIVDSLVFCLSRLGLPSLMRQYQNNEVSILMLHGVTEDRQQAGIGNSEGIHIHVDDLEEICELLRDHYTVISLDKALECLRTKQPFPARAVVLTFDDGYRSNYELAFPLLQKYDLHGTIFLATDLVENGANLWWDRLEYALGFTKKESVTFTFEDESVEFPLGKESVRREAFFSMLPLIKGLPQELVGEKITEIEEQLGCSLKSAKHKPKIYQPATWKQIREMITDGHVSIGGHTHTHRILGRCKAETIQEELDICRTLLREKAGVEDPLFSYPNGRRGDHTQESRRLVIESGFRCALTTDQGFNQIGDDPFCLKRFSTGNNSRYVDITASGTMRMLLAINRILRGRQAA